jgi:hypothetical protein
MTVNLAFITDLASEFATADSGRVDRLVALTATQFPLAFWGTQPEADLGQGYLICHMLKVDKLRGAGPLTSEAVGNVSRAFGTSAARAAEADSLDATSYGREYKRLKRQRARGVVVT